ncbi:helix-turn-helix transcriptional regulator [Streptomyces sp. NBC_01306]|uniref:helix-turn-helix domain-containing protein n=1 Tax=Streptomyces sp. NBC_01306 TaxID=2903819 RepID=UPI00224FB877|nr:helix-turn-helix transcriptional regulator [Streptomyces sp. NBC_01306]MCX4725034.1 helix-turn-helix domain-containing protein [Streptomyces sp. NBC_01306]
MADDETPEGILLSGEENAAVRIKLERDKRGWSTTTLSERLNEAGFDMNPSAVWRIENRKRRINLDEAIGFAEVFGVGLRNFAGPPQLAAKGRAMELIDNVVAAQQETMRAQHAFARARDTFDAYIAEHPDISEEAEAMVSNAIHESVTQMNAQMFGPPPGASADADHPDAAPDA